MMPIFFDEKKVLGSEYKRGLEEGRKEALEEGRQSELKLIRIMLTDRFGSIPPDVETKLSSLTSPEVERLAPRLLRAVSLEELFG